MDLKINNIIEPNRLLLRWQSTKSIEKSGRTHWIIGELERSNNDANLKYLEGKEDFDHAKLLGFTGYPGFSLNHPLHVNALSAFTKRLPPKSRKDFSDYLMFFCIPPHAELSEFALLGYTMARLPSDGFSIIHPFDDVEGNFEFVTEIAGFRYYGGLKRGFKTGDHVEFQEEPENKFDPMAVQVIFNGEKIGNITKGHIEPIRKLLANCKIANGKAIRIIERKDHPRAFIFVTIPG